MWCGRSRYAISKVKSMIYWQSITDGKYGLSKRISDEMFKLSLMKPNYMIDIRNSPAFILASDYSGSHKESKYNTYSFLVGHIPKDSSWDKLRLKFRKDTFQDIEKLSFKNFDKKWYSKLLDNFLSISDSYNGILFNFIIDKKIKKLFSNTISENHFPELIYPINNSWSKKSFDKLSLVATLGSIIITGLSSIGQDIFWISDQDEIAPNSFKHDQSGSVFTHYLNFYFPEKKGQFVFVTNEAKIEDFMFDDLVSIPDVAAGTVNEYFNYLYKINATVGMRLSLPIYQEFSNKTQTILKWLSNSSNNLKKLFFVLTPNTEKSRIDIHLLKIVLF